MVPLDGVNGVAGRGGVSEHAGIARLDRDVEEFHRVATARRQKRRRRIHEPHRGGGVRVRGEGAAVDWGLDGAEADEGRGDLKIEMVFLCSTVVVGAPGRPRPSCSLVCIARLSLPAFLKIAVYHLDHEFH